MSKLKTRKDKLVALQKFCNLETGELDKSFFVVENMLFEKARAVQVVNKRIRKCRRCSGLNLPRLTEAACGWGDVCAEVFFVGQSLHEPGMVSGVPFVKGSGRMVIAALWLSGLDRKDCYWSNVVHCHPENNRASTEEEKKNCLSFLQQEIDIVQPKLVVLLGNDAKVAPLKLPDGTVERCFRHPASLIYSAPEERPDYIVKLSLEIDKIL